MDVLRDVQIIEDELRFKDQELLDKLLAQAARKGKVDNQKVLFLISQREWSTHTGRRSL